MNNDVRIPTNSISVRFNPPETDLLIQKSISGQLPWRDHCTLVKAKHLVLEDGTIFYDRILNLEKSFCASIDTCESKYGSLPSKYNHKCQNLKFKGALVDTCRDKNLVERLSDCMTSVKNDACKTIKAGVPYLPVYLQHFCQRNYTNSDQFKSIPPDINVLDLDPETYEYLLERNKLSQRAVISLSHDVKNDQSLIDLKNEFRSKFNQLASQLFEQYRTNSDGYAEAQFYISRGITYPIESETQRTMRSMVSYADFPDKIPEYYLKNWKEFSACLMKDLYLNVDSLVKKHYLMARDKNQKLDLNSIFESAFTLVKQHLNLVSRNDMKKLENLFSRHYVESITPTDTKLIDDVKIITAGSDGCYVSNSNIPNSLSISISDQYAKNLLRDTVSGNLWR